MKAEAFFIPLKLSKLTSKWYVLWNGQKTILRENDVVGFKMSLILEGWVDIYTINSIYRGTIPMSEFKMNFRIDNLQMES